MPKKPLSADDDEGCQIGVGRTRSRAGADHEKARSRLGGGLEQVRSNAKAGKKQE